MRKIIPSITTTYNSDWQAKIREINKFGLKEIGLFLTCLDKKERQKLYKQLENSTVRIIPLAHMRSDMSPEELDYLIKKFQVKAFNMHSHSEFPFRHKYLKHRKIIFIENVYCPLDEKEIKKFGGICLDISHLENERLREPEKFKHNVKVIEKYPIGCNHISCIQKVLHRDEGENEGEDDYLHYSTHFIRRFSQLDYLKKFPKRYFSSILAIELENTIEKQLQVRDYLIKKIGL